MGMGNITLVGRLQDYADKAVNSFYKTAGRISSPILDTIASVDFAGSYFNNSSIPEYTKFQALHRNFLRDESAIAQIGGEFPAPGKKMELGWKDFWKIAAAVGVLSAAGGGYAYMKKKDIGMDDVDGLIAGAKAEIFGAGAYFGDFFNKPPATGNPIANASAVATPQATETPTPSYDYYDKDFKVGIMIEGDPMFKQNVTNLIETFKQVTPDDYADLIKYAPKKIMRSPDYYAWYGGPVNNDYIQIPKAAEIQGGSDDFKMKKYGLLAIVPEFGNAKRTKTGVKFNNGSEAELEIIIRQAKYAVKIGLWTQDYADNNTKYFSEQLNKGLETFYDGAKLNQS